MKIKMERFGAKPNFRLVSYLLLRVLHHKLNYILFCIAGTISAPLLISIPVMFFRQRQGKSNLRLETILTVFYMWLFTMWGLLQNYRAFLYSMFIEFGIVLGYLFFKKIKMGRILFAIAAANTFTQPVFFFFVSRSSNIAFATIVGELVVWLSEAALVYFVQHKQLSFNHILVLTLILNTASFGLGLLLPI